MPLMNDTPMREPGPFRADQLHDGDPYELVGGHPVRVAPAGGRHATASTLGALVLGSDPAVREAGVDAGFSPAPGELHAPDVSVGNVPNTPGWIRGKVPLLALEIADEAQDEAALTAKIASLLAYGTHVVWVVRAEHDEIEIHERGASMRRARRGDVLSAPGVLDNDVPVAALLDRDVALDVALRNLLQRKGFEGIEAIQARVREARDEGRERANAELAPSARATLLAAFGARGLTPSEDEQRAIMACSSVATLHAWTLRALQASSVAEALATDRPNV